MARIIPQELTIIIDGPPAVLKNRKDIVPIGKRCPKCKKAPRRVLVSNKAAKDWARRADIAIRSVMTQTNQEQVTEPCRVQVVTYAGDRRKRDLDNSLGGPIDALVSAGLLEDDSQVVSLDGSRLFYDKERPRVEMTVWWPWEKDQDAPRLPAGV